MTNSIRDVIAHKGDAVETVTPETTAFAAVERMNAKRIGAVLVVEDGQTIGIFTERDVLVRVVARGLDPTTTTVRKVMTTEPVTIAPDATIAHAMSVITDSRCRHLPVVDGARLCGLVSIGDLTSWIVRDRERTIADLHDFIRAA
jgi:CBS domain-containing protein